MATLTLQSFDSAFRELHESRTPQACSTPYSKKQSLPFGFPESIASGRVWSAAGLSDEDRFVIPFDQAEIDEIQSGLQSFEDTKQSLDEVSRNSFPLPILAKKLERIARQLHHGAGCIILRGLDPSKYTSTENLIIYLGITSHVADYRGRQDTDGNMLIHIKDYHQDGENHQAPYSNHAMTFHNDKCAVVALYAFSKAAHGGDSLIASSGQIYNVIAFMRPDLISVLADPSWPFNESAKPSEWTLRPLLFNFPDQGPAFCFNGRHLVRNGIGNAAMNGAPALSNKQVEALALVEKVARENACSIDLQPGDIQLLNNFSVLHARTAFQDGARGAGRHLVRLWLKNENLAWKEPENLGSEEWTVNRATRDDGSEIERRWPSIAESFTTERIQRAYEGCS